MCPICGQDHPEPRSDFWRCCWLALHEPRYQALGRGEIVPSAATAPPMPLCRHLPDTPITAGEVARLGLSVIRQWYVCPLGHGEQGRYVCTCQNCGPRCPDYAASPAPGDNGAGP